MKISTFFDHIAQAGAQTGKSLRELLPVVASFGISGIDISYPDLLKHYDLLVDSLGENGLAVSCVYETIDFTGSPDASQAYPVIDLAALAGAKRLLIIPGFLDADTAAGLNELHASAEDTFACMDSLPPVQNIKNALSDLVARASEKQISVTLEDFDSDLAPYSRIHQLRYFMERVPGLKTTFDMGNFAYAKEDVLTAFELLSPYIVHVHCKDRGSAEGLETVAVGSGFLPVAELITCLKQKRYSGYCVIEHFDAPDQLAFLKRSADFLSDRIR